MNGDGVRVGSQPSVRATVPDHTRSTGTFGGRTVAVDARQNGAVAVRTGHVAAAAHSAAAGPDLLERHIRAPTADQGGRFAARAAASPADVGRGPRADRIGTSPGRVAAEESVGRAASSPRSGADTPAALAAADPSALGNYLVNSAGRGELTGPMRVDLETAVLFASQVDADLRRTGELLERSATGSLSDAESRELNSLVLSNKHNLVLMQVWLADARPDLGDHAAAGPAGVLTDALQRRFADRLMDLADLVCRYEFEAPADEPVSRADRAAAHHLQADAAVRVARALDAPGLAPDAKQRLVEELEAHRDELAEARDVAGGMTDVPRGALKPRARQLWDAPLPLVKANAGESAALDDLRRQWSTRHGSGASPLPLAHAEVGQPRMLRAFIGHRLAEAGVARRDVPDLEARFTDAYNATLNDQPWDPIVKRVETRLPDTDGSTTVESRIEPGGVLARHFAEDYPAHGINCSDRTQYKHVPNLARTSAVGADGTVLFKGLRHGVIDPYGIDAKLLRGLPDEQLKTMVGDLLVRDGGTDGAERVEALAGRIRSDSAFAAQSATDMRAQASRDMAAELAVAALASDPAKFERACAGETVDVNLSSISLLTPDVLRHVRGRAGSDERTMLRLQNDALAALSRDGPVELPVRDAAGERRTVRANVHVRQFNFGVNMGAVQGVGKGPLSISSSNPVMRQVMGWGFAMARNNPHLESLLGPAAERGVGGDVAERIRSQSARAAVLSEERAAIEERPAEAPDGPDAAAREERIQALSTEIDALEKNATTLREAGAQLKSIWARGAYRRGGGDPYKMVSRLALVGQAMGETPVFNCKSGKDRTGQLDAEVKFLACAADAAQGHLPPVDADMQRWRSARSDFTLHTGNLEMQQLNTGLPGYKLKGVSGLKNMIAEGMRPVYRGGSGYVAA